MTPIKLTATAEEILKSRYLWPGETPGELFERVAECVSKGEKKAFRLKAKAAFLEMMCALRFLPNSPTLMNAGRKSGQLSACFVLPIPDSLKGIFKSLKDAALIHQSGGGTGFSFSRLRPRGARVQSTIGTASGPVSFLRIFDVATEAIKQGGMRRGANMGVLRVDHPDISEFITAKSDLKSILNFNLSVGITDEFMDALRGEKIFQLRDPVTKAVAASVPARQIFNEIVLHAWRSGDPGLIFLDRMNQFNPTPQQGAFEATNPCGEQPLLPYESCNLGSLRVSAYYDRAESRFNWRLLARDVHWAVRFLDDVIEVNDYPLKACETITRKNRKIGLGIMGFADLLLCMGIPYDSSEAIECAKKLMSFIEKEARKNSALLARERGPFSGFRESRWACLGHPPLRNATLTTIAPTGTISAIAGTSSGIEPIFSAVLVRNVLDGKRLVECHPVVRELLGAQEDVELDDMSIGRLLGKAWQTSRMVSVEAHIRMQAVFQKYSDSAVSKTINLPESATVDDVEKAYLLAYESGCKGITIYRDKSRPSQVLESGAGTPTQTRDGIACVTC